MSGVRVNIPALRRSVESARERGMVRGAVDLAAVLALIDAVESARRVHDARKIGGGSCELCEALAVFEFDKAET